MILSSSNELSGIKAVIPSYQSLQSEVLDVNPSTFQGYLYIAILIAILVVSRVVFVLTTRVLEVKRAKVKELSITKGE